MIKNFKWLLLVSLTFAACSSDDDTKNGIEEPVVVIPGTADFSKYVALGDSFAAGYSDNSLFKSGQESAYPNILSQQFALAGGGTFTTPFMNDNIGGFALGGVQVPQFLPRLYLNRAGGGSNPEVISGVSTTDITAHLTGPFNNMGIPGAKAIHLGYSGYASLNPYFGRIATSASATVIGDALAQNPTFFSLWIGGNDVLGYATNGGVPTSQDAVNGNDITPTATFDFVYKGMIDGLTAGGRKGVIANLPYINTLPFFTTVPYNPLSASVIGSGSEAAGIANINALNAQLYGPLKAALSAFGAGDRINLLSTTGANPLLIKDETLPNLSAQLTAAFTPSLGAPTATFYGQVFGQARQANSTDLVLLTTRAVIGTAPANIPAPLNKYGITYPLQDKHVLVGAEIAEIKTATDAYNLTIKTAAESKGLAFVDTYSIMNQLLNGGIPYEAYVLKADFATGGAFSLDGIHPTARGYALIANEFSKAINTAYGSNLPMVKLTNYPMLRPEQL